MRFSKFFIHTLKETPRDVALKSHEYLIRAGLISQSGSGIYSFLPLGKIVLQKISDITKYHMDKAGANEVLLGCITPASLWRESGRYERYGKELLRLKDRKDNDFVFGPTHEETITDLTKNYIKSYKQLPIHLYQIQTKFRDEIRPRFGLMRAREFIMKDGYSFHSSYESLKEEFDKMERTYSDIFRDLGLDFRVVEADNGAIGGSGSKEFMVLANSGEDTICVCNSCSYGANLEIATRKPKAPNSQAPEANFAKFHTPNIKTIESLCEFFKIDSYWTIKAVVKKALFDDGVSEYSFFFLRGSDSLNETKALNATGANELCDVSEEEISKLGLFAGFIGPYALRNITNSKHIYFDSELNCAKNMICGANELDYHFVGVDLNLFEDLEFKDLLEVKEGDMCPRCNVGELYFTKGIEVGHIFQLGDKYSKAMSATFLDENGKTKPYIMGCYGIGISRLIAAIIEQNHDEVGIKWTKNTAPFMVDIIISNIKDENQRNIGEDLYSKSLELGVECIVDDRNERFGAKIADFELIGFPYAIIVGKGITDGKVELVCRENLQKQEYELSKIDNLLHEVKKCL